MRTPLSVGVVIGAGSGIAVARTLADDPHVELRWVCDASTADRGQARRGLPASVSWTPRFAHLLEDEELDAIVFAVPLRARRVLVREALEADKHVFVVGLLASTVAEADELVHIAARHGRHLAAHHAGAARPAVGRLRSLLDRGALGEILYVEVARNGTHDEDAEPGLLWSLGAEAVALGLDLLGDQPIDVEGRAESYLSSEPEVVIANLVFATGISLHLAVSVLNAQPLDRITVVGTHVTAVVDAQRGGDELTLYAAQEPPQRVAGGDFALHAGDVLKTVVPALDPLRSGCEQFVAAVRSRFEPQTGREAAAVVGVLEALERSANAAVPEDAVAAPPKVVQLHLR